MEGFPPIASQDSIATVVKSRWSKPIDGYGRFRWGVHAMELASDAVETAKLNDA